ncbi:unnamed protein product [Rhodiola kirilowii]
MFAKLLANQDMMQAQIERMETHNKMLDNQIAQQAESSTRAQGKLPARPEQGQREHCNAVTLRSGKELEGEQPKRKKISFDLGGQVTEPTALSLRCGVLCAKANLYSATRDLTTW